MDAITTRATVGAFQGDHRGGGPLSNTPPQNLHSDFDPAANRLTGGEDWFEAVVYLRWNPVALEAVAAHLDAVKEEAAEGGDGWTQSIPGSGGLWKVEPTGARLGGAKGPIMRWRFSRDGIVFLLTRRADPHKTLPSGLVRITGDVLIAHGDARPLWEEVKRWFAEIGAEVTTAKLSRVDLCVDLPDVDVEEFVQPYHEGRYTTRTKRTREHCTHLERPIATAPEQIDEEEEGEDDDRCAVELYKAGRRYTGLRFGTGTQLRIYDKLAECRDVALRAWLAHRRWGGVVPDKATRVEFQLRRSFLTAEKVKPDADGNIGRPVIDTVEDYFTHRAALARYLVSSWVCFWAAGFDPRHPERATVLKLWKRVADDFKAWTGDTRERTYQPMRREEMPVDDLMKQALGCIESAAARCGLIIEEHEEDEPMSGLWSFAADQLWPLIDGDRGQIPDRVFRKMKALIRPLGSDDPCPV